MPTTSLKPVKPLFVLGQIEKETNRRTDKTNEIKQIAYTSHTLPAERPLWKVISNVQRFFDVSIVHIRRDATSVDTWWRQLDLSVSLSSIELLQNPT